MRTPTVKPVRSRLEPQTLTDASMNEPPLSNSVLQRLLIPEILYLIFGHLDKKDLGQLSTVCREWSKISLELLWRDMDSLFPLLETACPLVQVDRVWDFTREPGPEDWLNFRRYARLILTLKHDDRDWISFSPRVLSEYLIPHLRAEESLNGPLLPRLKELEWTATESPRTASHFTNFLSPALKSFILAIGNDVTMTMEIGDPEPGNLALCALAHRTEVKLERLEIRTRELYLEDGSAQCLHHQTALTLVHLSEFKINGKVDRALDNLPGLQSLYVEPRSDSLGDTQIIQWLGGLHSRFPQLTELGISFGPPFPIIPMQQLAQLLRSNPLVHLKLGFNPAVNIDETDVVQMAKAWPALESLWMFNWGHDYILWPMTLLSHFARHMPTLKKVALALQADSIPPPPHPRDRFPSLEVLDIGHVELPSDGWSALAAFLGNVCPPGVELRGQGNLGPIEEERGDLISIVEMMRVAENGSSGMSL